MDSNGILNKVLSKFLNIKPLQVLPFLGVILAISTIFLSYVLTMYYNYEHHHNPFIYISGAGVHAPERSFFAIGLTATGAIISAIGCIVYLIYETRKDTKGSRIVNAAYLFATFSAGGHLGILSCFNMVEFPYVHSVAASNFFFSSVGVQIFTIFHTQPIPLRVIRAIFTVISFFLAFSYNVTPSFTPIATIFGYDGERAYDYLDRSAAVQEWTCVLVLIIFFITYTHEFGRFDLRIIENNPREEKDKPPAENSTEEMHSFPDEESETLSEVHSV